MCSPTWHSCGWNIPKSTAWRYEGHTLCKVLHKAENLSPSPPDWPNISSRFRAESNKVEHKTTQRSLFFLRSCGGRILSGIGDGGTTSCLNGVAMNWSMYLENKNHFEIEKSVQQLLFIINTMLNHEELDNAKKRRDGWLNFTQHTNKQINYIHN